MLTIAPEKLAHCRADLERVTEQQWAETGDPEMPPAPSWDLYARLEANNALVVLIGRDAGRFVGYMGVAFYSPPLTSLSVIAAIPTYWVEPTPARALRLRRFFSEAAKMVYKRGVKRLDVDTSEKCSCGRLLEAMGFKVQSTKYSIEVNHA